MINFFWFAIYDLDGSMTQIRYNTYKISKLAIYVKPNNRIDRYFFVDFSKESPENFLFFNLCLTHLLDDGIAWNCSDFLNHLKVCKTCLSISSGQMQIS